ncbi:MAG: hypothetical protein H6828_04235 [Planctomycetes bacterium]|nr:hypothetical protein [Planctomycetota bacterium]
MPWGYLGALLATLALESAVACASPARRRVVPALAGLNLVSHPLGWTALAAGVPWLAVELCVAAFEVLGLAWSARVPARHALLVAVGANVVSALAGWAWSA